MCSKEGADAALVLYIEERRSETVRVLGSKELDRGWRRGPASDEQIIEFNCKTVGMI